MNAGFAGSNGPSLIGLTSGADFGADVASSSAEGSISYNQAVYTRGMDSAPDLKEIFDGISQEYEMSAVYGKKLPADAVKDAARRAQMIVDWNK